MSAKLLHKPERTLITLSLLVVFLPSLALGERLPLKSYTTADGLAHNVINRIVRDSRGFLWFCTDEGLSRFDGYTFTTYGTSEGLPHPSVNDLLETRVGEYWVATGGGLVRFNPKGVPGSRVIYAQDPSANAPGAPMFRVVIPADADRYAKYVTALREGHDGTLWCGTFKGLFRLVQDGAQAHLLPVDIGLRGDYTEQGLISSLLEDRFGTLWIGTFSGLYRRWPDGSVAHYDTKDGLAETIHVVLEDRHGGLWVGTRSDGLFHFNITPEHSPPVMMHNYTSKDALGTNWIFDLFESADGNLWVGTNRGFCELSLNDAGQVAQLRAYTKGNGLSYQEIACLAEDRDGNLWLGTNNNGAQKLARPGFTTFDERDGLSSGNSFFESNAGELYVHGYVLGDQRTSIFEGGKLDPLNPNFVPYRRLGHFDGQRFRWFIPASLLKEDLGWSDKPLALEARSGEWWIATGGGLFLFPRADSPAALKTARPIAAYKNKELARTQVYSIYEDAHGDLWVATVATTGNGLFRWERTTRTLRDIAHTTGLPSLKDRLAAAFQEDRAGNLWVGFAQGELARYSGNHFELLTAADGLTGGRINALYLDHSGRLWVATSRGVSRIDEPGAAHPAFINYSTAQGLSGNVTFAITEDLYDHIYIGTGQGLDQLNPATGRVKHYTTADGLTGGKISAAFRSHEGWLWIGSTQGLSRFLPEPERQSSPPLVLLTGLRVAGLAQNVSAIGETELRLPDLAASASQLQIDFVGLGFAPGESLRYQYMLVGADHDWSAPTTQRTVTYARLASGHYRFLVHAMNADGQVSAAPATIAFRVLPPLWLRWWFIVLAVLVVSGAAFALYRYRVARLLEMANMRTHIAADLHDDIGANLSRIAILSEVAKQQFSNGDEERPNPLASIADIARESVASMSDIVWAINPERDSMRDLTRRMRQHADEVFTLRDIDLEFDAPAPDQNLKLGVKLRRDLLLIFKEAVNNAARHAKCSRVKIDFRARGPELLLVIADNGVGFSLGDSGDGHGLMSMQRRARKLGGTLEVETQAGKGTTVSARIPMTAVRVSR